MPYNVVSMAASFSLAYTMMIALILLGFITQGALADVQYCANINTGNSATSVVNIYQSNGACSDTCRQNYAFAVVQGNTCWCSNYAPGTTTSGSSCNENCPGYPAEQCGSSSSGLFGYIALNKAPSGTQAASGSNPTTASSSKGAGAVTVIRTVIPSTSAARSLSTSASSSAPASSKTTLSTSTTPATTSSSTSSTWTPTPTLSLYTITGVVETLTVTPTAPPKPTAIPQKGTTAFFSNAGKVAGLFVGLASIILIMAGVLLFCCWRRRLSHGSHAHLAGEGSTAGGSTPRPQSRSMSQLGLMNEDRGASGFPRITTSLWGTPDTGGDSPSGESERRNSRAKVVDQRLDPQSLWNPLHDNSSRVSVRSLQDDRDYSRRVLKLANPDP